MTVNSNGQFHTVMGKSKVVSRHSSCHGNGDAHKRSELSYT